MNKEEIKSSTLIISFKRMLIISLAHLTIGIGIIALSTYIPAELTFLGWNNYDIAYLATVATLFELSRLIVGYLGDTYPILGSYRKNYIIIGFIISIFSFIIIANFINTNYILIGMICFTLGSAIMSTMIDAYLIDVATTQNKNRIAALTQFFRLSGFALGGILGIFLYPALSFEIFYYSLLAMHVVISVVSISFIKEDKIIKKLVDDELNSINKNNTFKLLLNAIKSKPAIGMSIFLLLYPIGLFMQDSILEPFAIAHLNIDKAGIGRMAGIWGTTTLIFIPLAIKSERKFGRLKTIFTGLLIASTALLLIASLSLSNPGSLDEQSIKNGKNILYLSLALFGIGLGLMTTPGTAMMFDICSYHKLVTSSLIAWFGMIVTIGRAISSLLAGLILQYTTNYTFLFVLEAIILFSSLFPLIYVTKQFKILGLNSDPNSIRIPDV